MATEANSRGDLFARLMKDLFLTLGYDQSVRLNIHKSGREVDLEALHTAENKRAVAECKAENTPTGGAALNKFVGVLDAERRTNKVPTVGYFVSLNGFRETAIEQEKQAGGDRVILFDGHRVATDLVRGHVVVSPAIALERAGRCVGSMVDNLTVEEDPELLAHNTGWVWAVYYQAGKVRTHFTLVHADGGSLSKKIVHDIVACDRQMGGTLHPLTYLEQTEEGPDETEMMSVRQNYCRYLAAECGDIQLEGLPADGEAGSKRLNLETIFVPLRLAPLRPSSEKASSNQGQTASIPVGQVLAKESRLAILAAPGGGKSTLVKRIAVAYAYPDRLNAVDDGLPPRDWLPLLIRCRQLGPLANSSITEILQSIPVRAELGESGQAMVTLVDRCLRDGKVILLVDGLDEIVDDQSRMAFVLQLRTFLATYPTTSIVITSREAGFRIVGGSLASQCQHYTLAEFDDHDITRLTLSWHREVVGFKPEVEQEALRLAQTIRSVDRVKRLAGNPLLLTTLLLVKRWVGQLPTRRSVLYGKAIEVLLMTWNVEGHEPLDQEEVIPQLAFVAYQMMVDGVQSISSRRLRELLTLARKQMPEILGYPRLSVNEFVDRVELRSSLLMLSGYDVEEGTLYPLYEFRHLTFQEYLTAKAVVEGFYPDRKETDQLVSLLEPHMENESWQEVIPLAAVLAGRSVTPLIQYLTELTRRDGEQPHNPQERKVAYTLLGQCLLDEAQVAPDVIREALHWIARTTRGRSDGLVWALGNTKYGAVLREVAREGYAAFTGHHTSLGDTLGMLSMQDLGFVDLSSLDDVFLGRLTSLLNSGEPLLRAVGGLVAMESAYQVYRTFNATGLEARRETREFLSRLGDLLSALPADPCPFVKHAAAWAYAWLGRTRGWSPEGSPQVVVYLLEAWVGGDLPLAGREAAWAISTLPVLNRGWIDSEKLHSAELGKFLLTKVNSERAFPTEFDRTAALVAGYYAGIPWQTQELLADCRRDLSQMSHSSDPVQPLRDIIRHLSQSKERKRSARR